MQSPGRNLVVCCDGTGNVWKPSANKTNVVKLVECLRIEPQRQLHYYDPGVGTPDGHLTENGLSTMAIAKRVAGLVWGDGVWTNVAEAYRFLMNSYLEDDRIFLFGFSRGAFTARAVSGLLNLCGLMRPGLENLIPTALSIYRMRADTPERKEKRGKAADQFRRCFGGSYESLGVHFIGVWDTVESVGLGQLLLGARITSDSTVKHLIRHVRHAVALDEFRWAYEPRLYSSLPAPGAATDDGGDRSVKQVWFCGAHCDVGGGYGHDGLSNAALHWMAREAAHEGLLVDFDALDGFAVDMRDKLHDESLRIPLWALLGVFKRDYPLSGMTIHETVRERIDCAPARYRPLLPGELRIESTHPTVPDGQGDVIARPVPKVEGDKTPTRERFRLWHWLVLGVAAVVAGWRLHSIDGASGVLAQMQLLESWSPDFGHRLLAWQAALGASVRALIAADYVTIALYAVVIGFLLRLLLHVAGSRGYPGKTLGIAACYSGGLLPVADLLENWCTVQALAAAQAGDAGAVCFRWFPCKPVEAVLSLGVGLAAVAKWLLLIAFVCVVSYALGTMIARWFGSETGQERHA